MVLAVALGISISPSSDAAAGSFPALIPLPDGFRPEGIAVGRGSEFFVGSIPTGAIYRGDLRTGNGAVLVPAQAGRAAIGLSVDRRSNYLFVAGGGTGKAFVYDAQTGADLASYVLTPPGTFINDVVVTRDAAYFTNSSLAEFYELPLGAGGGLPAQSAVQSIALGGDFVTVPGFNSNGIDATSNGSWLIIVNSAVGALYRVDPATGYATRIALGSASVANGDGILLQGMTLYVVQNFLNQIAVVDLDPDLASGTVSRIITDSSFRIPTTLAAFGSSLYAVNARFDTSPTPTTEYEVVQVPRN